MRFAGGAEGPKAGSNSRISSLDRSQVCGCPTPWPLTSESGSPVQARRRLEPVPSCAGPAHAGISASPVTPGLTPLSGPRPARKELPVTVLAVTKQDPASGAVLSSPRRGSGGLTSRSHRPFGACEAAPGPLESLASASAEAYPAWVWPAHPAGRFAWSMPPRDRVHQQGAAVTPGGAAGATVRAAFSESARTVADAARVLAGRTGGPGCHAR